MSKTTSLHNMNPFAKKMPWELSSPYQPLDACSWVLLLRAPSPWSCLFGCLFGRPSCVPLSKAQRASLKQGHFSQCEARHAQSKHSCWQRTWPTSTAPTLPSVRGSLSSAWSSTGEWVPLNLFWANHTDLAKTCFFFLNDYINLHCFEWRGSLIQGTSVADLKE